ncbi:Gfo/Idh/MocA family oxidoreductase [Streptomyces sp. NPDC018347]|uniref:Gfo/Idh/MocA family oxidoreductase n=1 Tax=Streptomyces sp. NPDC018347 TaxID=3157193 RepID=UPI0033D0AD01
MTAAPVPAVVRLAVLGTDHVHLPDYLEVVARDPRAVPAAVYSGGRAPVAGVRPTADAAGALAGADAAVIVSTTAQHGPLLRQGVEAGVPALVEKPLAASAEETGRLAALLAAAERPVTTAMFLRCAPEPRAVRTRPAERALGELAGVHLRFTHPGLLDGVFTGSRPGCRPSGTARRVPSPTSRSISSTCWSGWTRRPVCGCAAPRTGAVPGPSWTWAARRSCPGAACR